MPVFRRKPRPKSVGFPPLHIALVSIYPIAPPVPASAVLANPGPPRGGGTRTVRAGIALQPLVLPKPQHCSPHHRRHALLHLHPLPPRRPARPTIGCNVHRGTNPRCGAARRIELPGRRCATRWAPGGPVFSSDSVGLQRVAGGGGGTGFGIYLGWIGRRAAGPDTGRIADTAPKDRQELRARRCRPLYTRWSERYDKVLLFIFESGANHVAHRGKMFG